MIVRESTRRDTTQAMQFSAFKGPFEERIEAWNHKLFIIGEVLDKWLEVRARRLFVEFEPLEDGVVAGAAQLDVPPAHLRVAGHQQAAPGRGQEICYCK